MVLIEKSPSCNVSKNHDGAKIAQALDAQQVRGRREACLIQDLFVADVDIRSLFEQALEKANEAAMQIVLCLLVFQDPSLSPIQ